MSGETNPHPSPLPSREREHGFFSLLGRRWRGAPDEGQLPRRYASGETPTSRRKTRLK